MSLSSLESGFAAFARAKELYAEFERARADLANALADVPEPCRAETVAELVRDVSEWLNGFVPKKDATANTLPPRKAIMRLLRETPNQTQAEIVERLRGKVRTKSGDPDRLVSITVTQMKGKGRIVQDDSGRFRLPS